jgi:Lysyl oxidase
LRFDRYELRRASDHQRVRPDFKSGFCLGDRYDTERRFRAKPRRAMLRGQCRPDEPGALTVGQGISVGYGDDYPAYLEGQSIDITGIPSGRYELVHRVNVDRSLRESNYSNNSASVLLNISLGRKRADARLVRRCPGKDWCPEAR